MLNNDLHLFGIFSESSWGPRRCCQKAASWSQFPEDQRCFWSCSQSTSSCEEAQQPMPALDFWSTSLNATTSELYAETAQTDHLPPFLFVLHTSLSCPTPLLPLPPSSLESASIPPSPRQYVHSIICTLSLTELPSPPLANFLTLSTPHPQHTLLSLSDTVERVWNVPQVVSVMCVLLMELVGDASRNWSRTRHGFSWRNFGFRGCIIQSLRIIVPNFEIGKSLTR